MDKPQIFEYTSAAVPVIDKLEPKVLFPESKESINTPNLCIRYLHFKKYEPISQSLRNSSSHVFYILEGGGKTTVRIYPNNDKDIKETKVIEWNKGDVFTLPYDDTFIDHVCSVDSLLFYANDSPLMKFLGVKPSISRFLPTHYKKDFMMDHIIKFNEEDGAKDRNRNGILLSNSQMVKEKMNTLTHTMWSLLNSILPHVVQKPHKHNSIAVDLCIYANEKEHGKVFTLMGKELDKDGNIIDPVKMTWKSGCTFTTPPGWWHSHHNESDEIAWVFPVQDAGLHTYLRTLDIQFVK
tara:strand:- start:996 stop:1880 length:885 start_codon:yes stop_codon:yes gene_type:complete